MAIITLIETPIIQGIINDVREESQERSVELYASAVRNGIAAYQLREEKEAAAGTYTSEELLFDVEYDGNVECTTIDIYEDGGICSKLYSKWSSCRVYIWNKTSRKSNNRYL